MDGSDEQQSMNGNGVANAAEKTTKKNSLIESAKKYAVWGILFMMIILVVILILAVMDVNASKGTVDPAKLKARNIGEIILAAVGIVVALVVAAGVKSKSKAAESA